MACSQRTSDNLMILTDTHAHLYLSEFDADRDAMIQRAFDCGVERIFLPNIDSSTTDAMLALVSKYPGQLLPMMGLHPCSVKENWEVELKHVEEWHGKECFYAVGEIGIDLYRDTKYIIQQEQAFRFQIQLAKKLSLPVVIHVRNSFENVFRLIDELNDENLKGIFHCFSGTLEQTRKIIAYGGFRIGIGGVATFKNGGLDKVLPFVGMEHIVLETDSPYLAPVPHRGKRNETAYIALIAHKLAQIHNISADKIAEITTKNAMDTFMNKA